MRIIVTLIFMALGAVLVIKTEWFLNSFGSIEWADAHLGTEGGSRLAYKLIGVVLILGTLLWATGVLGPLFLSIFGRLFGLR